MTHRLLAAALVLGLTTTGALCGDSADADTSVSLRDEPSSEASSGPSDSADRGGEAARPSSDKSSSGASDDSAEAVGSGGLRQHSGELATGDATLETGEYVDAYTIDVEEGQTVVVDMMSTSDLDPYVFVASPSGEQWDNDDYEGDRTRSHVEQVADQGGTWRIRATSYAPGEEGTYDITIRTEAGGRSGGSRSSGGK